VNERYAQTGELASLACAIDAVEDAALISYGDLLFRSYVLRDLLESKADFSVVVDSLRGGAGNHTVRDFAYCSRGDDRGLFGTPVLLARVVSKAEVKGEPREMEAMNPPPQGRWIGMLNVSARGLVRLKTVLAQLRLRPDFERLDMPELLNALIAGGAAVEVLYVHGHWRGVNDLEDLERAVDFAHAQSPLGHEVSSGAEASDHD